LSASIASGLVWWKLGRYVQILIPLSSSVFAPCQRSVGCGAEHLSKTPGVARHTPFDSFVVPGIFLAAVIGGSATIGATALLANWRRALVTSAAAGTIMVGWILGETLLVEGFSWLQGLYLLTGSIVVAASIRLSQATTPDPEPRAVVRPREDQEVLR